MLTSQQVVIAHGSVGQAPMVELQANACIDESIFTSGRYPGNLLKLAAHYYTNGGVAIAIAYLSRYMELFPNNLSALTVRARWNILLSNYKAAIEDLQRIPHQTVEICQFYSVCHFFLGNMAECLLFFEKCVSLHSKNTNGNDYRDSLTIDWRTKVIYSYYATNSHSKALHESNLLLKTLQERSILDRVNPYNLKNAPRFATGDVSHHLNCKFSELYDILASNATLRLLTAEDTPVKKAVLDDLVILSETLKIHPHLNSLISLSSFMLGDYALSLSKCLLILTKDPLNHYAYHAALNLYFILGKSDLFVDLYIKYFPASLVVPDATTIDDVTKCLRVLFNKTADKIRTTNSSYSSS